MGDTSPSKKVIHISNTDQNTSQKSPVKKRSPPKRQAQKLSMSPAKTTSKVRESRAQRQKRSGKKSIATKSKEKSLVL
jgi:hypothetical protein